MRAALSCIFLLACPLPGADPDYTIMVLPDTQYLVFTCSPQVLNVMMNWIATNKSANLGNTDQGTNLTLNTKAVIGLGDITQQATNGEFVLAAGSTTSGYGIIDANSLPAVFPPGNHDWTDPTTAHTPFANGFIAPGTPSFANCSGVAGFFSASCRAVHGYFDGTTSLYGDKYDEGNYYIKLVVGTRHIIIFGIEYQPRAAVLAWAKTVHDANSGWEVIIATHSFHTHAVGMYGEFTDEPGFTTSGTSNNNDNGSVNAGLKFSGTTSGDTFNSGYAMWNGYTGNSFTPLKSWSNLTMILNGHWIAVEGNGSSTGYAATPAGYHYQTSTLTSTSSRAQAVQSIYTNWQDIDGAFNDPTGSNEYPSWTDAPACVGITANYCTTHTDRAYCPTVAVTQRMGHVLVLQFRPVAATVEGYIIATTNGKWEPTFANRFVATTTTPQLLFTLPYPGVDPVPGAALTGKVSTGGTLLVH